MALKTTARKACACVCAVALAFATMGSGVVSLAPAYASDSAGFVAASDSVECDNGWALDYSVLDSEVRITGVAKTGTGKLTIPSSIGGRDVTSIGASAFSGCTELTSVTIPDTVTVFKTAAFLGTGLTSVTIPASVTALSYRCFKNCTSLSDVQFEGKTMLYLGQETFMYCSALKTITLPQLTSHPLSNSNADEVATAGVELFANNVSIDKSCFAECTALESITFDGVVEHDTPDYFLDISCFNDDSKLTTFIWKTKADSVPSGTSGNVQFSTQITDCYYTLDFYNSEEDAAALTNRVASVSYEPKNSEDSHNMVKILSLINGTEDYSKYKLASCSDSIPEPPEGKVWGVADNGVAGDYDTLTDSYQVIAVDEDDIDYGWVSSPDIYDYYAAVEVSNARGSMYDANVPTTYIEPDGSVPDVDKMAVYSPDGSVLTGSQYKLVYEKAIMERRGSLNNFSVVGWEDTDAVDGEGTYRVHAENTENDTETATVEFVVTGYEPSVHAYMNYSFVNNLGAISADAAGLLDADATTDYNVVVPSSDWRFQLIGAGLAAAGNGLSLYDNGADTSNDAYRAHVRTGANSVQILGSTSTVPQSTDVSKNVYLCDWLLSTITGSQTRYRNDSTPQALSEQVYGVMTGDAWSASYGTTAVVVPSETGLNILPVAQTIYDEKAPVFFTSEGALSSADLALLQSGGFDKVIVAGTTSDVSEECVSQITGATGVTPERVLDSGSTPYEASLAYAEQLVAAGNNSYDTVVVADGSSSANVTEAAQVAALSDGIMLVCSSSRDVKKAQNFLYKLISDQGVTAIEDLYLVGNFQSVDPSARTRLRSIWSTPLSTEDSTTDTVAADGATYQLTSAGKAQLVKVSDAASTTPSIDSFTSEGTAYTVTAVGADAFASRVTDVTLGSSIASIDASAFASSPNLATLTVTSTSAKQIAARTFSGMSKLASVSYAGAVTSIGASAFKGCTALTDVSFGSSGMVIGASAFSGCTKLAKLSSGSSVKTIGASAFRGCTSLASASFGSRVTSVGASAFSGCTKLASVGLGSQVTSVGASAFKGCTALADVTLGSKVASIGASAFYNCKKLSKVAFGSSVKTIGASAFSGCTALASASLGSKVTSVGASAFYNCKKLSKVAFGTSVKTIGASAFQGCSALKSATFGKKLAKIGTSAFYGCKKLKTLTIKSSKLKKGKVGSKAFKGTYAKMTVKVPKKKKAAYKKIFVKKGLSKKAKFKKC